MSNSRQHFWIHIKTGSADFKRLMVSNHKQIRFVRQQFITYFHNKTPVKIVNAAPGKECFFFNHYTRLEEPSIPLNLSVNDADAVRLMDIDDKRNVLSAVKFTKEVEIKTY